MGCGVSRRCVRGTVAGGGSVYSFKKRAPPPRMDDRGLLFRYVRKRTGTGVIDKIGPRRCGR
jgi:hypothetical protein